MNDTSQVMLNQEDAAETAVLGWQERMRAFRLRTFSFVSQPSRGWAVGMRQWHQRAGLFAALFMFWLGSSGFVLNQSASWGLDAIRVGNPGIMSLYGLYPRAPEAGFYAAEHWLAQTTEHTVVNGIPLPELVPSPLGLIASGEGAEALLFVTAPDRIVIVDSQAQPIDELRDYTLPVSSIRRVGQSADGRVVIQDAERFSTRDGLSWEPAPADLEVRWSKPEALQPNHKAAALPFARPTVPLEQVLIDAHTGRLFGRYGVWIVNLVGFAAMFLGISGAWIYVSTARRRRQRARS